MKKKIKVPYFPIGLKLITPALFGLGIYLFSLYLFWALILITLSIMVLTTNYVTEINLKERKCRDYLSLLGFPFKNETIKFEKLDRIAITKGNHAQTVNTRSQSRQFDWSDYTGTLLFDDNGSLDLLTRNKKSELIKGLKEFAESLKVNVEDRTTRDHYWIDIKKV